MPATNVLSKDLQLHRFPSSRDVAKEVQDFYDRYPYPPPVENLERYRHLWEQPQRRRAEYHLLWPTRSYREDFSILVAGCGTSQAAKHALRWPAARVTGIDVSTTSVRCTEALKHSYKLDNLQIHHLAIERVHELGTRFDHIVCTGVLHHLADPDAALKSLRDVLEPGGAMHLMVYAPYGRTGVYMLQEFCRRLGVRATDRGIRDLIAALRELPPGHPLEPLMRDAPDFRQEAALADALLHPQDRAYSVAELFDFIGNAGLTFGRWLKQAPYSPHCGVMASIPQASRLKELAMVEQYSAVELYRGTMARHSVVAYRSDNPEANGGVSFTDDSCLGYVPIRVPDTIDVHERLPPGAAAVLINQTHVYRDLVLPIDALEKRLLDAVDGNRCLGEMVEDTLPSPCSRSRLDKARRFFEQLWRYDQVVFDAHLSPSKEAEMSLDMRYSVSPAAAPPPA